MSENQEMKNSIIESYDGDPDDLVFFQPPEQEEMEEDDEFYEYEESEEEVEETLMIDNLPEKDSSIEIVNGNASTDKLTSEMKQETVNQNGTVSMVSGEIDLNDPHYANFELDPYYDYGYGPEPKAKNTDEKKEATTLGIISMSTGIGSIFFMCCGIQYLLALGALITGIWCLCLKGNSRTTKTFAIVGIVCACLPFLFAVISVVFQIFTPMILSNI